jgi:hypothetical protein
MRVYLDPLVVCSCSTDLPPRYRATNNATGFLAETSLQVTLPRQWCMDMPIDVKIPDQLIFTGCRRSPGFLMPACG